jgi:hypothetical protein
MVNLPDKRLFLIDYIFKFIVQFVKFLVAFLEFLALATNFKPTAHFISKCVKQFQVRPIKLPGLAIETT